MLKMFVVVMVLGQPYGVAGPLEYSMWQCPMVLNYAQDKINQTIASKKPKVNGKLVKRSDVTSKCVMAAKMPKAKYRFAT